jgi:serine/threonine protein kinase
MAFTGTYSGGSLDEECTCVIQNRPAKLQPVGSHIGLLSFATMVERPQQKEGAVEGESSHSMSPPPSSDLLTEYQFVSSIAANELECVLRAGQAAAERSTSLQKSTQLEVQRDLAQLSWDDIFVEDFLGVGGFACVCLVTCPKLYKKSLKTTGDGSCLDSVDGWAPSEDSWASSDVSLSSDTEDLSKFYACKCLSSRTMASPKQFISGATDLVAEAFLLSRLSHPNIIRIYGVTAGNTSEAFLKRGGYFLMLEVLDSTLNDMIQVWRRDPVSSLQDFFKKANSSIPSVEERLSIIMGVAKGMEYLHSQNILFRDLKPHNVGLDREGNVRLFDFGLARETTQQQRSGIAGSLRYMSPETLMHKFTCQASDVYSFGVLVWELCTLLIPYPDFQRPSEFKQAVGVEGHRPDGGAVDHPVKTLIEECWTGDPSQRTTFSRIVSVLEGYCGNSYGSSKQGLARAHLAPSSRTSSRLSRSSSASKSSLRKINAVYPKFVPWMAASIASSSNRNKLDR